MLHFLHTAYNTVHNKQVSVVEFHKLLKEKMALLAMDPSMTKRSLNEGFSGGEKKRAEILQMMLLEPAFAVLDETDSGLDVDALKIVAQGIQKARNENMAVLIITHYYRILDYITPDFVHVLSGGKVVHTSDASLAREIEQKGFEAFV